MLDKIQFLLSLQIIGFCIFGGATLLLRAGDNRAKKILDKELGGTAAE